VSDVLALTVLTEAEWTARQRSHERRIDELVGGHLNRRHRGMKHPVEDFLFTYYSFRPAQLRRWHPGAGVILAGAAPHAAWRGYVRTCRGITIDPVHVEQRAETIRWVRDLLAATAARPAFTGCFGLHEWAMVYRTNDVRH
jgi:hypothetical protein